MDMGVVYVAIGEQFLEEARISALSLKNCCPNLDCTIFSDRNVVDKLFDKCVKIESSGNGYLDKISGMANTPYRHTLFLDSDTYIYDDFSELFTLLNKYEIGAALAESRAGANNLGQKYNYQEIFDSKGMFVYPMYNSGVILYKINAKTRNFFNNWHSLANKQMDRNGKEYGDQPAFQRALHESDLREVILAPEYNCRFWAPLCVSGKVKIFHGRCKDIKKLSKQMNKDINTRIFHPKIGMVYAQPPHSKTKCQSDSSAATAELRLSLNESKAALATSEARLKDLDVALERRTVELQRAERQLENILASRSWKITRPLRMLAGAMFVSAKKQGHH